MKLLSKTAALCVVALLALPALASAHARPHSLHWTYPHASHLCAQVARGHAPHQLAGQTAAVTAACTALETSYTTAKTNYVTSTASVRQQIADALKQLRQTCQQAHANHDPAACRQARQQTRTTLQGLEPQLKSAAQTYEAAIKAARQTFLTAINALRPAAQHS